MEAFYPGSSAVERRFAVEVVELPERVETTVGPFRASAFPVEHASGAASYGLRLLAGGKVVACSGDTAWTDALLEIAHGADLFLCEAYTYERAVRFHLPYAAIRSTIADSIQLVMHIARRDGRRTVDELLRIDGYDHAEETYRLRTLYRRTEVADA